MHSNRPGRAAQSRCSRRRTPYSPSSPILTNSLLVYRPSLSQLRPKDKAAKAPKQRSGCSSRGSRCAEAAGQRESHYYGSRAALQTKQRRPDGNLCGARRGSRKGHQGAAVYTLSKQEHTFEFQTPRTTPPCPPWFFSLHSFRVRLLIASIRRRTERCLRKSTWKVRRTQ